MSSHSAVDAQKTGGDGANSPHARKRAFIVALITAPCVLVLLIFMILPLLWIVRISFYETLQGTMMNPAWVLDQYVRFLGDLWYLRNVVWLSIFVSVVSTAVTVVLAYPIAIYVARATGVRRQILQTLVLAPLLIGLISLVFGWIVILRSGGLLNSLTIWLGIVEAPVRYLYAMPAVYILLVYLGIPFVVMTLLDNFERIESTLLEAAANAGASDWRIFTSVTLPLTLPGLNAGVLVLFALNFSAFAIPLMVGSANTNLIGLVVYKQAMQLGNLPFAAAISIIMVAVSATLLIIYSRIMQRWFLWRLGI